MSAELMGFIERFGFPMFCACVLLWGFYKFLWYILKESKERELMIMEDARAREAKFDALADGQMKSLTDAILAMDKRAEERQAEHKQASMYQRKEHEKIMEALNAIAWNTEGILEKYKQENMEAHGRIEDKISSLKERIREREVLCLDRARRMETVEDAS